jgi:hypothetical protein
VAACRGGEGGHSLLDMRGLSLTRLGSMISSRRQSFAFLGTGNHCSPPLSSSFRGSRPSVTVHVHNSVARQTLSRVWLPSKNQIGGENNNPLREASPRVRCAEHHLLGAERPSINNATR